LRERGELVERLRQRVSPSQAARSIQAVREQQALEADARARTKDEERAHAVQMLDPEIEDVAFMSSNASSSESNEQSSVQGAEPTQAAVEESSSSVDATPPSEVPPFGSAAATLEDEVDTSFLASNAAPAVAEEVEEDVSFLAAPPPVTEEVAADVSALVEAVMMDADAAAEGLRFEIVGTHAVSGAQGSRYSPFGGAAFSNSPSDSGAPSLTHILVREHLRAPPPTSVDDSDASGGEHDVQAGRHVDHSFLRDPHTDAATVASVEDLELDGSFVQRPAAAAAVAAPAAPSLFLDQLKRTPLSRDDAAWTQTILPGLARFGRFLTRFLASPRLQREYLLAFHDEQAKMRLLKDIVPEGNGRASSQRGTQHANKAKDMRRDGSNERRRVAPSSPSSDSTVAGEEQRAPAARFARKRAQSFVAE